MKKFGVFALSLFISQSLFSLEAFACTTFCLKKNGEVLFGKNYDWMIGDGLIFVNKRGVVKTAMSGPNGAKWTSRYGSVTFNQYGRENPMGGMNEAGLVIELMWLDETMYPKADSRPTLDTLEWIQYQLDTAATAAEVIKNAENVRIESLVKLHYLINDRNGNSATIEFLDGNLIVHTGEKLPVAALANDTYEKSWSYAKTAESFGGTKKVSQSTDSLDRFIRAAEKVREFEKESSKDPVEYAFAVLENVAQKDYTKWSIVYDQKNAKIYFRTAESRAIKSIDAKAFDYTCGTAVKILDINTALSSDVTGSFTDYSSRANRDLIERSFNGTFFLRQVPASMRDSLAKHTESFTCAAGGSGRDGGTTINKSSKETLADAPKANDYLTVIPLYFAFAKVKSLFQT